MAFLLPAVLILKACSSASSKQIDILGFIVVATFTVVQKRMPENALKGLAIASGLQAKIMAS
ncbi:MAG: hypothetical protein H7069_11860 [Phormidesmis sp. FL-bin-119]|nr:hypothetical protein [Pedobacter sp.]